MEDWPSDPFESYFGGVTLTIPLFTYPSLSSFVTSGCIIDIFFILFTARGLRVFPGPDIIYNNFRNSEYFYVDRWTKVSGSTISRSTGGAFLFRFLWVLWALVIVGFMLIRKTSEDYRCGLICGVSLVCGFWAVVRLATPLFLLNWTGPFELKFGFGMNCCSFGDFFTSKYSLFPGPSCYWSTWNSYGASLKGGSPPPVATLFLRTSEMRNCSGKGFNFSVDWLLLASERRRSVATRCSSGETFCYF